MGATAIHHNVKKKDYSSPRQAFNALVEEAQYQYGHDPYSGTIATCEFYGEIKSPETSEAYNLALEKIGKREVYYYETPDNWEFMGWAAC